MFDFATSKKEFEFDLHHSDVRSVDWHPTKSLIITGSKDSKVMIWDPRCGGKGALPIHAHNNTINQVRWNPVNGNWFLTGSKDQRIKVFDVRKEDREINCFEGQDAQVSVVRWHPHKEELFASSSYDG